MIIKRFISTSFLIAIIFISGCVDQNGEPIEVEYKDEALKMEIEITDIVLPSQALNMKVYLTNQVKDNIGNIEFRVTDFYGLELVNQICPKDIGLANCGFFANCGCGPFDVQSLDQEEMSFVFKVPSKEEIARIGRELKPEFTLTYGYKGETTFLIPIIDKNEKTTSAELKLIQTEGPIHVDISRGFTSSSNNWERDGDGFSILVKAKDVVNPNSDQIIDKNEFKMTLLNLQQALQFGECDFGLATPITNPVYPVNPNGDIVLPMKIPIGCSLEALDPNAPWAYGTVKMEYNYMYKIIELKTITIETVID